MGDTPTSTNRTNVPGSPDTVRLPDVLAAIDLVLAATPALAEIRPLLAARIEATRNVPSVTTASRAASSARRHPAVRRAPAWPSSAGGAAGVRHRGDPEAPTHDVPRRGRVDADNHGRPDKRSRPVGYAPWSPRGATAEALDQITRRPR